MSGPVSHRTSRPSAGGPGGRLDHGRPRRHGREYRSGAAPCQGRVSRRVAWPASQRGCLQPPALPYNESGSMLDKPNPPPASDSLVLSEKEPFAKGGKRHCYVHPANSALCVTVLCVTVAARANDRDCDARQRLDIEDLRAVENARSRSGVRAHPGDRRRCRHGPGSGYRHAAVPRCQWPDLPKTRRCHPGARPHTLFDPGDRRTEGVATKTASADPGHRSAQRAGCTAGTAGSPRSTPCSSAT